MQRDLGGPSEVRRCDLVELRKLRAFEGRIGDATDRKGNVVWCQLAAVLEPYICAQIEYDGRVIAVAPAARNLRDYLAADVPGDKVVEDVPVDRIALGVPLQVRSIVATSPGISTVSASFG